MKIEINNLTVVTKDKKEILKDFSLTIKAGEVHALMGPNGTGKSTLSKVLLGSPEYEVVKGDILVDGKSILKLSTDERAKLGFFLSFQSPISIEGVTNTEFLKTAINTRREEAIGLFPFMQEMRQALKDLHMDEDMMLRSINQDFSGGERKKNEILQMKLLQPSFIILDELDSGLDVDSLRICCENIATYLKEHPKTSVLVITHYPRILEYLPLNYVHRMQAGRIVETGDFSLAQKIEKEGYLSENAIGGVVSHE